MQKKSTSNEWKNTRTHRERERQTHTFMFISIHVRAYCILCTYFTGWLQFTTSKWSIAFGIFGCVCVRASFFFAHSLLNFFHSLFHFVK